MKRQTLSQTKDVSRLLGMKHLVGALALMALGLWGMAVWWSSFGLVMRGLVPFALLGFGLVALLSGYNRISGAGNAELDDVEREIRS